MPPFRSRLQAAWRVLRGEAVIANTHIRGSVGSVSPKNPDGRLTLAGNYFTGVNGTSATGNTGATITMWTTEL